MSKIAGYVFCFLDAKMIELIDVKQFTSDTCKVLQMLLGGVRTDLVGNRDTEADKVYVSRGCQKGREVVHQKRQVDSVNATRCQCSIVQRWAAAVRNRIPYHAIHL
jgi:hypothetical protein